MSYKEYITPQDHRVMAVVESWRGVRPVLHYSYSRCKHLPADQHVHTEFHDIGRLVAAGHKKQKLRAHSDFYPNHKVNDWVLGFWDQFDIQCEAKAKNLAQQQLYEQAITRSNSIAINC